MGNVYLACHDELGQHVAIKTIREARRSRPQSVRRFINEARYTANISHPYLAKVFDILELDDQPAIVMEFVEGRTLAESVDEQAPLRQRVRWLAEVAEALAAIHEAGVVHRDVKPSNVMVARDGHARLLDLGLAIRRLDAAEPIDRNETETTTFIPAGTPAYSSPEVLLGERPTSAADLFAFGTMAYELLAGSHPFANRTETIPQAIVECEPGDPQGWARLEELPGVAGLIRATLAKQAGERPQDVAALASTLRGAARSDPDPKPRVGRWAGTVAVAAIALVMLLIGRSLFAQSGTTVLTLPCAVDGLPAPDAAVANLLAVYLDESRGVTSVPISRSRQLCASAKELEAFLEPARRLYDADWVVWFETTEVSGGSVSAFSMLSTGRGKDQQFSVAADRANVVARRAARNIVERLGVAPTQERGLVTDSDEAAERFARALTHRERFEYSDALTELREVVALDSDFLLARLELGVTLVEIGDRNAARAVAAELAERQSMPDGTRLGRRIEAFRQRATGEFDAAIASYLQLCSDSEHDIEPCLSYVNLLVSRNKRDAALEVLDAWLPRFTEHVDAQLVRARVLAGMQRGDEAAATLERVAALVDELALDAVEPFVLETRGLLAYQRGDYRQAIEHYRAATLRYQEAGLPLLSIGPLKSQADAELQLWNLEPALQLQRLALEMAERAGHTDYVIRILNSVGGVELRRRDLVASIAYLERSAASARQAGAVGLEVSARLNLLAAFALAGRFEAARASLPRLEELAALSANLRQHYDLRVADLERFSGETDRARERLERMGETESGASMELSRLQRLVLICLAENCATLVDRADAALNAAERHGAPDRIAFTQAIRSVCLHAVGERKAAADAYDEAERLLASTLHGPVHRRMLALALTELGRADELGMSRPVTLDASPESTRFVCNICASTAPAASICDQVTTFHETHGTWLGASAECCGCKP